MNFVQMGEIVEIRKGKKPSNVLDLYEAGSHPCILIDELRGKAPTVFTLDQKGVEAHASDMCIVWDGANAGTVGFGVEGYLGSTIARLRIKNSKRWDTGFLGRLLQGQFGAINAAAHGKGATIPHVDKRHLEELQLPTYPIDEQKRIAAILDQADELRRKRQRAIDRLNQLGQAIFYEMFGDATTNPMGWRTAQLGDIVRSGDKINYGVVQPGEDVEEGVPLVRVGDLLSGYIDPRKVKQIDASIEASYKRSRLVGNEILIGCVGSIGTVALAHEGLRGANIARAVARVPVEPSIAMRDFIAEQIKSPMVQRYFTSETRTVAQPTLNIGLIVSAPIILPPMPEQKKFAELIAGARGTLKNFIDHGSKEDELFLSLQHRAFRGEL